MADAAARLRGLASRQVDWLRTEDEGAAEDYGSAVRDTDFAALADEVERLQLERDQQERFKWAANERAERAENLLGTVSKIVERLEAVREAAKPLLAAAEELNLAGGTHADRGKPDRERWFYASKAVWEATHPLRAALAAAEEKKEKVERGTVTPLREMFEGGPKRKRPDLWGDPNRAERMRTSAAHGDWFVVSGLCKTCGQPYPCEASEQPLAAAESDPNSEPVEPQEET
jgi:hypothetical protein